MADKKKYSRISRINELIKRELATILSKHSQDPRLKFVTISEVDTSPDLANAKVFFCVLQAGTGDNIESGDAISAVLNKASGFFRKELARRVELRTTPRLDFCFDSSAVEGNKIHDILFAIQQSNKDVDYNDHNDNDDLDKH